MWFKGILTTKSHKTSGNIHALWNNGSMRISQQFSSSITHCFLLSSLLFCTWRTVFTCKLGHREGRNWTGREAVWAISLQCVQVTSYYPQDSLWPLLPHDRSPTTTRSHDRAHFTWSPAEKNDAWMPLVVRPKSAAEQANALAPINHPSVVSWTHTNLYVLDLCGRSNLTKIHTSLSSRSRGHD